MKTSFSLLLALTVLVTVTHINAGVNGRKIVGKPLRYHVGKFRPRSPRRYIIKCCTGGCLNPKSTNRSLARKIRTTVTPLYTIKKTQIDASKTKRKNQATEDRSQEQATPKLEGSETLNEKITDQNEAHLTTQSSANADVVPTQTINNNDGVAEAEVAVMTVSDSKPESTMATQRVAEFSTNRGAGTSETGATASGSSTMSLGTKLSQGTTLSQGTKMSQGTTLSQGTPMSGTILSADITANSTTSMAKFSTNTNASIKTISFVTTSFTTTLSTIISTTTAAPKCVMPDCSEYKKAKNSANVAVSGGTKFTACGRPYFIADTTETLPDAATFCSSMNMTVLSLESVSELFCLLKMFPTDKRALKFWTSGANDGISCDVQGVYAWCTLNEVVPTGLLTAYTKAAASSSDRCLIYDPAGKDNSSALAHTSCTIKMPYICEPTCKGPTCPSSCVKNGTLFNAQGKVEKPESFGIWMETCGDTYLFGNKIVTWQQNWEMCCSLGMTPLSLDSVSEQECLSSITKSKNWTGNHNYWAAGTQRDCRGSWGWCGGTTAPTGISDDIEWEEGQPDNLGGRQDCIHIKNVKETGLRLTDRNCTDRYILACKGNPEAKPAKMLPDCPTTECARNGTLFSESSLNNYHSYGTWHDGCGKYFMYSRAKAKWKAARETCCQIGLTLATVQTNGKRNCMAQTAYLLDGVDNEDYWVYGTDLGSPGKFFWCSNEREFEPKEIAWAPGEPNNKYHCVYLKNLGVNKSVLATADCETEKRFLCDVRKKGAGGPAMQQECLEIWGITTSDIDFMQTAGVTSANYTYNLKCFLKCMGEYAGMFAFGALVPGDALKMIEQASLDDPVQMQQGFNAYDECSSFRHDDECITAGEIYSCGRQKEPTIVDAIFNAEKGNYTIYDPPLPCIESPRHCVYEGKRPCVTNSTLRNEFLSTGLTSAGYKKTTSTNVVFFLGAPAPSLGYAYDYCCSLGMRLADVNSSDALYLSDNLPYNTMTMVGETYQVGGTTQNAYCRTKQLISPSLCYGDCAAPVCNQEQNYYQFFAAGGPTHGLGNFDVHQIASQFLCEEP